jgi:hypothetical protein
VEWESGACTHEDNVCEAKSGQYIFTKGQELTGLWAEELL